MMTGDRKRYEHFFRNVMAWKRVYGWTLNWVERNSEGYCWHKKKRIDIGIETADVRQLILHEIAHIQTCRFCNNKHSWEFWREFDRLMRKFLPGKKWSDSQMLHFSYVCNGYCRLCYIAG